ncbi:MAG: beta-ketoacyl synthase N-terminal-like domain-containing protein [Actinomycetota bacterium]
MPVLIDAALRSPFTRVDGALAGWHPVDLAATVMARALDDAGGDESLGDVWLGCAEPVGAQGANMARAAVLAAGWPDRIGGVVIDRAETSGMAALHAACAALEAGEVERAVVVGVSSATTVAPGASALGRTYGRPWGDGPAARVADDGGLLPAAAAADRAAADHGIGRDEQDAWAVGSHERRSLSLPSTVVAIDARPGDRVAIQRGTPVGTDDVRERPDDPAGLPPSFDPDGAITGFTFSPAVDGASAVMLRSAPEREHTTTIIGRGRAAGHPLDPTGAAAVAIRDALDAAGLAVGEVDRWEIAEPTAAAILLVCRQAGIDPATVNPNGGTLGVGDAAAAEELRLVIDGAAAAQRGHTVGCVTFGPTGSAVTVTRTP